MKLALAAACVALAACGSKKKDDPPHAPSPAPTPAPARTGLDMAAMKPSINPGDDFFAYANGTWLDKTEIPADRSNYGNNAAMTELTLTRNKALVEEAMTAAPGSEARKVGDYYASFLAEDEIEAKGLAPLEPVLTAITAIADKPALARALGGSLRADVDAFNSTNFETQNLFGLWVAQDLNDPSRYAPFLLQGGLGMPDRDYYLDKAPRTAALRAAYQTHVGKMLELAKVPDAGAKAARIVALETQLAMVHATRTESADIAKGNNPWKRSDFGKRAPGLDWDGFFDAAGLAAQDDFIVWHPKAVAGIAKQVAAQPLDAWKDYLIFHALEAHASVLPRAFVDESFDFYGKTLSGSLQLRDRWKRALSATNLALGDAVGKLYVAEHFPAAEKARAAAMVENVRAAFGRRIDALTWMSAETKAKAKAKLAVLKVGVGYPDRWREYGGLEVVRGDALGNARRASLFHYRQNLAKLGTPVDRGEWAMVAQVVNAVNLPAMNAMNFPAAILQPPNFDPNRPEVMDYGAIGVTMGHEISHSFDDQGALFDDQGRLDNWWTADDLTHFQAAAKKLIAQYDGYQPFPDLAVNGTLTVSENLADVAGLAAAYDAYRLSLGGKEAPTVDGLTGDQQFFLSFAQARRIKMREAALRRQLLTDSHSPSEFRVDTVRNLDAWYAAFAIAPGTRLYLAEADRVKVW